MDKFEEEAQDLIAAIKNYRKAYPNGEFWLRQDIYERVAELLDMDRPELD